MLSKLDSTEKTTPGNTIKKKKSDKNYSIVKEKNAGDLMFLSCKKIGLPIVLAHHWPNAAGKPKTG